MLFNEALPMTSAEWTTCNNPKAMLTFLKSQHATSERKLRLFSCACFRRIWYALTDHRAQKVVEVAERYADGMADDVEREGALEQIASAGRIGADAVRWAVVAFAQTGAIMAVDAAGQTAACPAGQEYDPARWQAEWSAQCDLLRCIFPNPFRDIPTIDRRWLAWNDGTVQWLAQAAYEHRSLHDGTLELGRLAVLADAIEEAGCTDAELLGHLRAVGPHVRGCFALDAVLGKS
jgi:hypothetical protein